MSVESPFDDVLGRWVPRRALRRERSLDARAVVGRLSPERQYRLMVDLEDLANAHVVPREKGLWKLSCEEDQLPAYVPAGPDLITRLIHVGLYAHRVLVNSPRLPEYTVGLAGSFVGTHGMSPGDVIRGLFPEEFPSPPLAVPTPQAPPTSPSTTDSERGRDDIDELLDALDDDPWDEKSGYELAAARLPNELPEAAATLLDFLFTIRRPIAEGWLQLVGHGAFSSENRKAIVEDDEFQPEYSRWYAQAKDQREAWEVLETATGLAHSLKRPHVMSVPGSVDSRGLLALIGRFYSDLPYGGIMWGWWHPTKHVTVGHSELVRGSWLNELCIGLHPALKYVDMPTVCDLREEGVAASLARFLNEDLREVSAASNEADADEALGYSRRRLGEIAASAERAMQGVPSRTWMARAKQAGVWGFGSAAMNYLGAEIAGAPQPVPLTSAIVGLGIGGVTGAAAQGEVIPTHQEPVLIELLRRTPAFARRRWPR